MSRILEHLHSDHKNMIRLLDLLDDELRDIASGRACDYPLVANIVEYFNEYPNRYHHPFEDKVFAWIGRERPSLSGVIDELRTDHELQTVISHDLTKLLDEARTGRAAPNERLAEELKSFVSVQRAHIDKEEKRVLKQAEGLLTGIHLREIPIPDGDELDPLFGKAVGGDFSAIAVALGRAHETRAGS